MVLKWVISFLIMVKMETGCLHCSWSFLQSTFTYLPGFTRFLLQIDVDITCKRI